VKLPASMESGSADFVGEVYPITNAVILKAISNIL